MPIQFNCPNCKTTMRTPDGTSGRQARCPSCSTVVTIPAASGEMASSGPPAPRPAPGAPNMGTAETRPQTAGQPAQGQPAQGQPAAGFGTRPTQGPAPTPGFGGAPSPNFGAGPTAQPGPSPFPGAAPFPGSASFPGPAAGPVMNPYAAPPNVPGPPGGGYGAPYGYPMSPEQSRAKLKGPAIGLIVCNVLSLLYAGFNAVGLIVQLAGGNMQFPNDPAEKTGFVVGMIVGGALIGIVPLISLIGSIQMLRGKSRAWSMTGAITGMLPCSFCCLGGLGFGIWALVVLNQTDVKQAMR